MGYTLRFRHEVTALQSRYDFVRIDNGHATPLAYGEQEPGKYGPVALYIAGGDREVAFVLSPGDTAEVPGSYEITATTGQMLATLRKDRVASLARSTYHLDTHGTTLTGKEQTWWRPILRRVLSAASNLPLLLPVEFYFTDGRGETMLTIRRQPGKPRQYDVTVTDDRLDWRPAAACAMAINTLMTFWTAAHSNPAR